MLTIVPTPIIFQSQRPKKTSISTTPMVTSTVSEHIFTFPKSFFRTPAIATGKPSPASISESHLTSQAMPNASSAPPTSSSMNCKSQPMA